jgi:hypothetical protein
MQDGLYIAPAFMDKLVVHIAKNFMSLPNIKVLDDHHLLYSNWDFVHCSLKNSASCWFDCLLLKNFLSLDGSERKAAEDFHSAYNWACFAGSPYLGNMGRQGSRKVFPMWACNVQAWDQVSWVALMSSDFPTKGALQSVI